MYYTHIELSMCSDLLINWIYIRVLGERDGDRKRLRKVQLKAAQFCNSCQVRMRRAATPSEIFESSGGNYNDVPIHTRLPRYTHRSPARDNVNTTLAVQRQARTKTIGKRDEVLAQVNILSVFHRQQRCLHSAAGRRQKSTLPKHFRILGVIGTSLARHVRLRDRVIRDVFIFLHLVTCRQSSAFPENICGI